MPHIIWDYQDKDSHDLLVELVIQGNSSVEQDKLIIRRLDRMNGSVASNCNRIIVLEDQMSERTVPAWMGSKAKVAGLGAVAVATASALVTVVVELIKLA